MKIEIRTVVNGRETEAAVKPRSGNICRCGTYKEVLLSKAYQKASQPLLLGRTRHWRKRSHG
jgi:hypothetical protein